MKVALVTGTRPQIIKSVPIIETFNACDEIELDFIHTGQHYDYELFQLFIDTFGIPAPRNLSIDVTKNMIAEIISKLSAVFEEDRPDLVIVPGDTNSALGAGLAASKMDIPFAHLEAGVRMWDMYMQEEQNRRMLDHTASLLLAPTITGYSHLINERVPGMIKLVGDTNYELFRNRKQIGVELSKGVYEKYGLADEFIVLTAHRRENLRADRLHNILNSVNLMGVDVLFLMHPRTASVLADCSLYCEDMDWEFPNIIMHKPVGYDDMMGLLWNTRLLITDSGGLQKEAYFTHTPCVSLREATCWVETVLAGANMLSGIDDVEVMLAAYREMYNKHLRNKSAFGDGRTSHKILDIILNEEIKIPRTRSNNF